LTGIEETLTDNPRTRELLRHLATRPGHDEVKSDFRQLLVEEFGAELGALDFERRIPEVKGRLDALIGRTVFEAKRNLDLEWDDVVRRMPDYLADREREESERFVGIASGCLEWRKSKTGLDNRKELVYVHVVFSWGGDEFWQRLAVRTPAGRARS
jgi:hypothetical protein